MLQLITTVLAAIGGAAVVREGLRKNGRWWREAGQAMVSGLISGVAIGLLLVAMILNPFFFPAAFFLAILFVPAIMSRRR